MIIRKVNYPTQIINAIRNKKLVIFAGAGVSMGEPTNMPNFNKLTKIISKGMYQQFNSDRETADQYLGELESLEIPVKEMTCELLNKEGVEPNILHKSIVKLFKDTSEVKIITTNYDLMFERALEYKNRGTCPVYTYPALPFGDNFNGIIHLHGNVKDSQNIILTDADFGKAYLTNGYVTRFLVELYTSGYIVLFVGYSYGDITMRYLSRAIPSTYKNKYILTSDDKKNWYNLGLVPILYETGKFDELNMSIKELADFVNRDKFEWNRQINKLSRKEPDLLTGEEKEEIDEILHDHTNRRLFLEKLDSREWVDWIENKRYLNNVFSQRGTYSEIDSELSKWLTDKFLLTHSEILVIIYNKNNCNINERFQRLIIQKIDTSELSATEFEKLMYFIKIESLEGFDIIKLIKKSNLVNSIWYTTQLFKRLIRLDGILKHDNFTSVNNSENGLNSLKLKFAEDQNNQNFISYQIKNIWKQLKELDTEGYKEILSYLRTEINKFELSKKAWDIQSEFGQFENLLELEEEYSESAVVSTILCDIIKKLEKKDPEYIKGWILGNINNESLLIKKISIFSLRNISTIANIEKARLIILNEWLFKPEIKQEVFLLLAEIFDKLERCYKAFIIYQIMKFIYKPKINLSEKEREITESYSKYNWLVWLNQECEPNNLIIENIKLIKTKYSYFEPRDNPELNISITEVGPIEDKSPITLEDINTKDKIRSSLEILLNYKGDRTFEGPNRRGLLRMVEDFSSRYKNEAIFLMEQLLEKEYYETDLWESLLIGLKVESLPKEDFIHIIKLLDCPELIKTQSREVSRFLYKVTEALTQLNLSNKDIESISDLTISVWRLGGPDNDDYGDLHIQTLNSVKGTVSWSWINLFKYEMETNGKEKIFSKYKLLFNEALKEKESEELIFVLVSNFRVFYYYNKEWTNKVIFSLLESENKIIYNSAWEGFLTYGKVYNDMKEMMKPLFLNNIKNISKFTSKYQEEFLNYYTVLMIHCEDDPMEDFIPALFEFTSSDMLLIFYNQIYQYLRGATIEERDTLWRKWLMEFLKKRKNNIPKKLIPDEVSHILNFWLQYSDAFYPLIVEGLGEIIIPTEMNCYFLDELESNDLIRRYPEDTKVLLLKCLTEISEWQLRTYKTSLVNIYEAVSLNKTKLDQLIIEEFNKFSYLN